jgi:DNA-binding CsgD family transcriptional regulator
MRDRENEAEERSEQFGRRREKVPDGADYRRSPEVSAGGEPEPRVPVAGWERSSWVNWQSALYVFVLSLACLVLVPLTSLWWIVPVLGALVPIVLAVLDRPHLKLGRSDDKKVKEQELLRVLAERGELTPATAAMRTSLTVDEASKMLEELARKGHLRPRADEGIMAYAFRERDRRELSGGDSPGETEPDGDGASPRCGASGQLEDPLSERELEVLDLLASGKTNSEVARDLFVSVGTVKSHTGNIYRKLDAKNRAEALARARELRLLQ